MNRIILILLISACLSHAELPRKTHIWHLDEQSATFSISVFNNTDSPVYVPERWGSSTCKWITDKGDSMSHGDGRGTTEKDLILLPARQTHTYTFTVRFPDKRLPESMEGFILIRLEYSASIFGISGVELTKPIALRSIDAVIDFTPNQQVEGTAAAAPHP